jgi:hypothetical protein
VQNPKQGEKNKENEKKTSIERQEIARQAVRIGEWIPAAHAFLQYSFFATLRLCVRSLFFESHAKAPSRRGQGGQE